MTGRTRRTPYAAADTTAVDIAPVDIAPVDIAPVDIAPVDTQVREAAHARRDAYENVAPADRGMVDALIAERRGYEQRDGMADRIAQVDEQLRMRGYETA